MPKTKMDFRCPHAACGKINTFKFTTISRNASSQALNSLKTSLDGETIACAYCKEPINVVIKGGSVEATKA